MQVKINFKFFHYDDDKLSELYEYVFDKLDNQCNLYYDCKVIYFYNDFETKLYQVMKKFLNLDEIIIEGSKWYDLECCQFPSSIKIINIEYLINLSKNFNNGKELLLLRI